MKLIMREVLGTIYISIWEFTDLGDYLFELITWDPWEGQNAEVFRGATDGVSLVIPMI